MSRRMLALSIATAVSLTTVVAGPALAAPSAANKACSQDVNGAVYACLETKDRTVPSGDTVTFTGTLSKAAMKNLKSWTKGDNIVCLDRFKTHPEADGSWPWTMLEGVCTTVRKDGTYTIKAEFGRKGTFYYGLEMGPCRAGAAECGDGDPGLVGVGGMKVVAVKTT
jgi:plastocyanin